MWLSNDPTVWNASPRSSSNIIGSSHLKKKLYSQRTLVFLVVENWNARISRTVALDSLECLPFPFLESPLKSFLLVIGSTELVYAGILSPCDAEHLPFPCDDVGW
jgi:hypothetical protein